MLSNVSHWDQAKGKQRISSSTFQQCNPTIWNEQTHCCNPDAHCHCQRLSSVASATMKWLGSIVHLIETHQCVHLTSQLFHSRIFNQSACPGSKPIVLCVLCDSVLQHPCNKLHCQLDASIVVGHGHKLQFEETTRHEWQEM